MRVQRIFVRKPVRKRPLKRPRRWEDNNIMMALLRGGLWGREANATGSWSYRPWRAISALVGRPPVLAAVYMLTIWSVMLTVLRKPRKCWRWSVTRNFYCNKLSHQHRMEHVTSSYEMHASLNTIIIRCLSSINSRISFFNCTAHQ
jgi:hypothetical protein